MHLFDTNIHYIIRIDIFYSKMSMNLNFEMGSNLIFCIRATLIRTSCIRSRDSKLICLSVSIEFFDKKSVLLLQTMAAKSRARDDNLAKVGDKNSEMN